MVIFERENKLCIQFEGLIKMDTADVIVWKDEEGVHALIGDTQIDGACGDTPTDGPTDEPTEDTPVEDEPTEDEPVEDEPTEDEPTEGDDDADTICPVEDPTV